MHSTRFVVDTSVLLNFGVIGRFGLLLGFLRGCGAVTAWVYEEEVKHSQTKQALRSAVERNAIEVVALNTDAELQLFASLLRGRDMSEGEAETIAAAVSRGWTVIVDERVATLKARTLLPPNRVIDTHYVLRSLVGCGRLTHAQAVSINDAMRAAGRWLSPFR